AENDFRAVEGQIVSLPCHSLSDDSVQVSVEWTKHSASGTTICKWYINNITGSIIGECIPRFKFNKKSFTLSIENVQLSDSGNYSCKTTILIPPPSQDNTTNVTLQVEARPHLQKLDSSNGTCIHLLCSMEDLTTELVNFTWSQEGHGSLHPFTSYPMKSELRLCKPDWSDGDTITCYANYSSTQTQRSIQLTSQKESVKDAENDFRTVEGETVRLPCHSPPNDSVQVSVEWTKHSASSTPICKWNINNITGSIIGECIPRFKFNKKYFTLSIENVQLSDADNYSCKTTRIILPPSLDYTTNVTLQVAARPHLQKLDSSNGTCIHLLCSMEGPTTELVNFTWSREGHGSLHPFTSYAMKSELRLCKPDWNDGDTITCYANYSRTQTQRSIQLTSQKESVNGGSF
ncbi:hypothetical protein cypCar_00040198, partial [Cyprinus carpio]